MFSRGFIRCSSFALLIACAGLVSCATDQGDEGLATADDPAERGDAHVRLPLEQNRDIMQAKLAHAHALLEGMALEDFEQIEQNAAALGWLAQLAEWRVHTTVAYGTLSAEFRAAANDLAAEARSENLQRVTDAYARMTASCIDCHTYLRREGLYTDVPGRVSWRP